MSPSPPSTPGPAGCLRLRPPYDEWDPTPTGTPPLGTILAADLSGGVSALAGILAEHRASPWCPLVVWGAGTSERMLEIVVATETMASVALLAPDRGEVPDPGRALRAVRARRPPRALDLAWWIARRLSRPALAEALAPCFGPSQGEEAGRAASPRTLRRRIAGPFKPHDWNALGRLARALALAQHDYRVSAERAAMDQGLDPRTLQGWLARFLDMGWREAHELAGWEWALEAALLDAGYLSARRAAAPAERRRRVSGERGG